ncbi:unnamed protein product, partial [Choristocarpus tenellus]
EEVALNQFSKGLADCRLAFIDRNRDLWVCPVVPAQGKGAAVTKHKLQTHVASAAWNDNSDLLTALADGRLLTWYCPKAISVDKDLLQLASTSRDASEFGKTPRIRSFFGNKVTVRRADGALLSAAVASYPAILYDLVQGQRWEEAVRLCRLVKNEQLWACMACMALTGSNLSLAEEALAAIKEVDKLEYVQHIQKIPSEEGRNAELALYRRCPEEAEAILLQASPPLTYRAIKLNIRLFRWSRALEVAVQGRTHVDTVLGYRQRYLDRFGKQETDPRFLQYAEQV